MKTFVAVLAAGLILLSIYFSIQDSRAWKKENRAADRRIDEIERMIHR